MDLFVKLTDSQTQRTNLGLPGRRKRGRDSQEVQNLHYTLLYLKWITNKALLYSIGNWLNVMWQPGWKGGWGRMDTYMAESLCCPPETITTLLIGYTPV